MAVGHGSQASFACRLCGGTELAPYYTLGNDGRYGYYRCPGCALVNLDLSAGMDQEQYVEEFIDPTDDTLRFNRDKDQSFAFLRAHVDGAGSLCDIGCGSGRMLYLARRAGWTVLGVELSPTMAAKTAEWLGVEVLAANFLTMTPSQRLAGAFDVVCLRHVLEHLPDSVLAMQKIRALLRDGGHALFEMPNIDGLDKRLKRLLVRMGLHRKRFPPDFVAGHCNEYCRESFEYLLSQTGFRLIRWETYSSKPLSNLIYNRWHVGNKARALVQKAP